LDDFGPDSFGIRLDFTLNLLRPDLVLVDRSVELPEDFLGSIVRVYRSGVGIIVVLGGLYVESVELDISFIENMGLRSWCEALWC
jgi:hypothetical protein